MYIPPYKKDELFLFLSKTEYWDPYNFYSLLAGDGRIMKITTVDKQGTHWRAFRKAQKDLWQLLRKAILRGTIKCKPPSLDLPTDIPDTRFGSDCRIEREDCLKWYKVNRKAIRKMLPQTEHANTLCTRNEELFKKVEASIAGCGEEVRKFSVENARKGGQQPKYMLGVQGAVDQILKANPGFTADQVWIKLKRFPRDAPMFVEGDSVKYYVYVKGKTIYQIKITLNKGEDETEKKSETKHIGRRTFSTYVTRAKK